MYGAGYKNNAEHEEKEYRNTGKQKGGGVVRSAMRRRGE